MFRLIPSSFPMCAVLCGLLFTTVGCESSGRGGGGGGGDDDDNGDDDNGDDDDDTQGDDDTTPADDDDDTTPQPDDDDDTTPVGGCTNHNQCDSDEFCYDDECEAIFGRSFNVAVYAAGAAQYDSNGDAWDVLGGMPDMLVQVVLDDVSQLVTATQQDSLSASWYEDVNVVLTSTSFCVVVWDEDVTDYEYMDGSCWNGMDAIVWLVREGYYSDYLYEGFVLISFSMDPNF